MVKQSLAIEEEDDAGLMMMFEDFYLQISFSELHPLMVIYLVRGLILFRAASPDGHLPGARTGPKDFHPG